MRLDRTASAARASRSPSTSAYSCYACARTRGPRRSSYSRYACVRTCGPRCDTSTLASGPRCAIRNTCTSDTPRAALHGRQGDGPPRRQHRRPDPASLGPAVSTSTGPAPADLGSQERHQHPSSRAAADSLEDHGVGSTSAVGPTCVFWHLFGVLLHGATPSACSAPPMAPQPPPPPPPVVPSAAPPTAQPQPAAAPRQLRHSLKSATNPKDEPLPAFVVEFIAQLEPIRTNIRAALKKEKDKKAVDQLRSALRNHLKLVLTNKHVLADRGRS